MKYKRVATMILVIFLLMSSVIYADNGRLNMQDALELALKNSPDIMKYTNTIKTLERDYADTVLSSRSLKDSLEMDERFRKLSRKLVRTPEEELEYKLLKSILINYMSTSQRLQLTITSELSPSNMQYMLNINRNMLQSKKDNIALSVYKSYNNISKTEESIRIKNRLVNSMESSLKSANLKYLQGKISYYSLLLIKLDDQKAKIDLNKLLTEKEKNIAEIHKALGVSLNNKYNEYRIDSIPEVSSIKSSQEYVDLALANRQDIKNAQNYYDIEEKEFEITKKFYYYETNINHKNALLELNGAKDNMESTRITVQLQVINLYSNLENQLNNMKKAKVNLELSQAKLKELQSKRNLGLATELELTNANISLTQSEIQYITTQRDAWLAKMNLDIACGIAVNN